MIKSAFNPLEETIGKEEPIIYASSHSWERDSSNELSHLRSVVNENRDDKFAELQQGQYKIGAIVVEAALNTSQIMSPVFWGVIVRFEKNNESNGIWRPIVCRFFNRTSTACLNPNELLIVYHAMSFDIHMQMLEGQRKRINGTILCAK